MVSTQNRTYVLLPQILNQQLRPTLACHHKSLMHLCYPEMYRFSTKSTRYCTVYSNCILLCYIVGVQPWKRGKRITKSQLLHQDLQIKDAGLFIDHGSWNLSRWYSRIYMLWYTSIRSKITSVAPITKKADFPITDTEWPIIANADNQSDKKTTWNFC